MQEELIKKCRLTDVEFMACAQGVPIETEVQKAAEPWRFGINIMDNTLRKALPIIQKAERERIINALKFVGITLREDWEGLQVHDEVLIPDPENKGEFWQALKGEADGTD